MRTSRMGKVYVLSARYGRKTGNMSFEHPNRNNGKHDRRRTRHHEPSIGTQHHQSRPATHEDDPRHHGPSGAVVPRHPHHRHQRQGLHGTYGRSHLPRLRHAYGPIHLAPSGTRQRTHRHRRPAAVQRRFRRHMGPGQGPRRHRGHENGRAGQAEDELLRSAHRHGHLEIRRRAGRRRHRGSGHGRDRRVATNVLDADAAIIGPVDMDHMAWLGDTESRNGSPRKRSASSSRTAPPSSAASHTRTRSCRLSRPRPRRTAPAWCATASNRKSLPECRGLVGGQVATLRTPNGTYTEVPIAKFGEHQAHNALAALCAAEAAIPVNGALDGDLVAEALSSVRIPGRIEQIRTSPTIILDGGHNVNAAESLRAAIEENYDFQQLVGVVATDGGTSRSRSIWACSNRRRAM